jgi:peptide methionine sulfoxide reductase msrA/msrB
LRRSHKKMFLYKNALSQKRSEYRPLGWKNFGECSIRLRWGSQNLGSFLLVVVFSSCTNYAQSIESMDVETAIVDTLWTEKIVKPNSFWKEALSSEQYSITREKGTERPFTHAYSKNYNEGIYLCNVCENPLFSSETKFKSGTGWPSYWKPYFSKSVNVRTDSSLGMTRDELTCNRCDSHIGHVFIDGPKPTGLRYCINGKSLKFVKEEKLAKARNTKNIAKAVFAQGCFWCVEEIFESIKGVSSVLSGYSGGSISNPSYKKVSRGATNHAETIEVTYDSEAISYDELLKVYFNSGDITQVNGQGNDVGKQYRSIVFYKTQGQKEQIETYISKLSDSDIYSRRIAVEVLPLTKFCVAEKYHQDYAKLNPNQGYVKGVSIPRYKKAIRLFPELLKQ